MVRISNLDIIKILREDGRRPLLDIARELNVSETAVRKRVKNMEKQGIIKKYTLYADPKKIGFEIDALIGIDTKPELYLSMLEKLKKDERVLTMCSSSGDHMILIECWFKNTNELGLFVKELQKTAGIIKICPAIIIEKIK